MNDQNTKRIVVFALVFISGIYVYFTYILGPVSKSESTSKAGIASLEPQVADAKKQIAATADLEKKAPAALLFVKNVQDSIPDGAAIAWFPPKISQFFKNYGCLACTTRLVATSEYNAPGLEKGLKKATWAVDLPKIDFLQLRGALAKLREAEPLVDVSSIEVGVNDNDPLHQHTTIVLSNLVKTAE